MKSISISISYNVKWRLKEHPHYLVTTNKKVINSHTGRIVKETLKGAYTRGFWIGRTFIPTNKMNDHVEIIPHLNCPF